jgi:hypothetical protein
MNHVTAPGHQPPQPGQDAEEPEQGMEDDIPAQDHDPDGTQPGPNAQAHDGDEVERHGDSLT